MQPMLQLQTIGSLLNIPSLALFRTCSHHVRIILPFLPATFEAALSLDLFLIRPPEGAAHRPVKPSNIVVGGDSAGGGLAMALLQVIRDADLPLPAGAVLVSPWCDLHHSFPSIFLNTETVWHPSPLPVHPSPYECCISLWVGRRSYDWSYYMQAKPALATPA
jgi:hypothetical protein